MALVPLDSCVNTDPDIPSAAFAGISVAVTFAFVRVFVAGMSVRMQSGCAWRRMRATTLARQSAAFPLNVRPDVAPSFHPIANRQILCPAY